MGTILSHMVEFLHVDDDAEALYLQTVSDFPTTTSIDERMAESGILPEDHALSKYARAQFSRIHRSGEPLSVYATEEDEGVNAFATNDNRVFVTRSLLEFCETDEELLYVLQHERRHHIRQHLAQKKAAAEGHAPGTDFVQIELSDLGQERIFEMGEADIEGLIELDEMGINIDGAFTFTRRFNERFGHLTKEDRGHGSSEDRLLAFKALLAGYDLKNFKEGAQTPKTAELTNPELYKKDRGFPFKGNETLTKAPVWEMRSRTTERLSAYELRVNLGHLEADISKAEENIKRGKQGKPIRSFTQRLIEANEAYLNQARPLRDKMQAYLVSRAETEHGLSKATTEATQRLKTRLSTLRTEPDWKGFLADTDVKADLLTITQSDLMKWGTLYRSSQGQKLDPSVLEPDLDEDAKQVVALLYTGKWLETKRVKKKEIESRPANWTPDDAALLTVISHYNFKDAKAATNINISTEKAYQILEAKIMKRTAVKPYSANFLSCFEIARTFFSGVKPENIDKLKNRVLREVEDNFEQCCLLSFIACAVKNSHIKQEGFAEAAEGTPDSICNFLTKIGELEQEGCKSSAVAIGVDWLENIYAPLLASDFQKGMATVNEVKARMVHHEHKNLYAEKLFRAWFAKAKPYLNLDQLEELDPEFLRLAGASRLVIEKVRSQMAVSPAGLAKDKAELRRVVSKVREIQEGVTVVFVGETKETEFRSFYNALKIANLDLSDLEDSMLGLELVDWSADPMETHALENQIWERVLEDWDSKGYSVDYILSRVPSGLKVPFEVMNTIMEDHTETEDEMRTVSTYLESRVKDPIAVGKTVFLHDEMRELIQKDRFKFLKAILRRSNDDDLKNALLGLASATLGVNNEFEKVIFGEKQANKVRGEASPDQLLRRLYALDETQKRLVVHMLLTGENGVLKNPAQIGEVVDQLFEEYVDDESGDETDGQLINDTREIIKTALRVARPEDSYLIISGILAKRILQVPYEDNWETMKGEEKLVKDIRAALFMDHGLEDEEYEADQMRTAKDLAIYGKSRDGVGFEKEREPVKHLVQRPNPIRDNSQMDAVGLLLEIAQSLRSIGTRGLQTADMYMDLPPKYQGLRENIYSNMEAQYKAVAFHTLLRNIPEDKRRNLKMGKRIGGGAMVTVYSFSSDTMEGVVKVLGPNVEAFTETTVSVLDKTFGTLLAKEGERFRPLSLLLEDIRWWVLADMDLAASAKLDDQFKAQNDGFAGIGSGKIKVPEVFYRDSRCLIEARVHGKTLDKAVLPEGEREETIDLLRWNVANQVMNGIMHSDIQPGNLLKGDDGDLYWLDRTLLLLLSDKEKDLLFGIQAAPSDDAKVDAFVEGLLTLPENQNLDEEAMAAIRLEKTRFTNGTFENRIKGLSIQLRRHKGFTITPKLTLVFKNLLGVNRISERLPTAEKAAE